MSTLSESQTASTPVTRYQPSHIAGNPASLTPLQRELIARVAALGPRFADRAERYDREASFPFENYDDLRAAGLLGICVPKAYGGLGADFATYVMVAAEIGRHCGSTAWLRMHSPATSAGDRGFGPRDSPSGGRGWQCCRSA